MKCLTEGLFHRTKKSDETRGYPRSRHQLQLQLSDQPRKKFKIQLELLTWEEGKAFMKAIVLIKKVSKNKKIGRWNFAAKRPRLRILMSGAFSRNLESQQQRKNGKNNKLIFFHHLVADESMRCLPFNEMQQIFHSSEPCYKNYAPVSRSTMTTCRAILIFQLYISSNAPSRLVGPMHP